MPGDHGSSPIGKRPIRIAPRQAEDIDRLSTDGEAMIREAHGRIEPLKRHLCATEFTVD